MLIKVNECFWQYFWKKNSAVLEEKPMEIQISEFKIQKDPFGGVFDKLNHRIGMTSTIKQSTPQQFLTP
ncbi:MAG: hypothetical protein IJU33_10740 [Bacteroidales bacterium]|nr:hypothetical protein [Bacteroidales bacterium]